MPAPERRSVGELLADTDFLARETLLDLSPTQAAAMVRTWASFVVAAARLWSVLPADPLSSNRAPDTMTTLHGIGMGIGRSVLAGRWPGPGPADERLSQMSRNLARAADLVLRYGRDVEPTSAEARADLGAARSRIMHALYVGAHGTIAAVIEYGKDLQVQQQMAVRRKTPHLQRESGPSSASLQAVVDRLGVFEQVAGSYVAAHPVTLAVLGEVRAAPPANRLQSALTRWDIQVHRTLAANPGAPDLVRAVRVQALIASTSGIVTEAATAKGAVEQATYDRLRPSLEATQVGWTRLAQRWGELTDPDSRVDRSLVAAASDLRAVIGAVAFTPTGWATPDQLNGRLNLAKTVESLRTSIVTSIDVAYLAREVAATQQGLTAPARVTDLRSRGEAGTAASRGSGSEDLPYASRLSNDRIRLTDPVRRGLVDLTTDVIARTINAVAAAQPLATSQPKSAQPRSRSASLNDRRGVSYPGPSGGRRRL